MNLAKLSAQLEGNNQHPPVEKWNPPFCGDMDIHIKADGQWLYMGSPIGRKPLVKLFASVLCMEGDEYFLKTPVEKVRISVEDAPFIITSWQQHQSEQGTIISLQSNVDDNFVLGKDHQLLLANEQQKAPLYVNIHREMQASVHRNVYYQLADIAEIETIEGIDHFMIQSGREKFCIGKG